MNRRSPVLLAIDTTSDACSAAMGLAGQVLERHEIAPRQHARLLLPMVQSLLQEAEVHLDAVDAFVVGRGPGAFTGVRIGIGVVQGLAFSTGRPVVPVSSLALLAQAEIDNGARCVAVAVDARMDEVYWGTFEGDDEGLALPLGSECVIPPERAVVAQGESWLGVGSGFAAYPERLGGRLAIGEIRDERLPRAACALALAEREWRLGRTIAAQDLQPVYLRDRVVRA